MKKLQIFLQNSTKIQYKVQIHSLSLGSNFEDNIKSRKNSEVFSFAKAFWYENEQTKSKIRGIRRDNTILHN